MTSHTKWLTIKVMYVLGCVVGVVAVLMFASGVVLAIGLTIVAFFIGGIFELFTLRYQDYREDWEQANSESELGGPDTPTSAMS